jgi:hypothetical protein
MAAATQGWLPWVGRSRQALNSIAWLHDSMIPSGRRAPPRERAHLVPGSSCQPDRSVLQPFACFQSIQARAPDLGLSDRCAWDGPRRRQRGKDWIPAAVLSRSAQLQDVRSKGSSPTSFIPFTSTAAIAALPWSDRGCAIHHFMIELGNLDDLAKAGSVG